MKTWRLIRAILLCVAALVVSGRVIKADINCCDLCMYTLDNDHRCDGCDITTLGSCQWFNVETDSCACHPPDCTCGGGGDPYGCDGGGCNGGLCPEIFE
jgi:hypothetical protein